MKRFRNILGLALAVGVLAGALAGPAAAAWEVEPSGLEAMADLLEETESENRGRISLAVGESRDLNDMVRWRQYDSDLGDRDRQLLWQLNAVVWKSSNESVASVDKNGVITAHKVGVARITATGTDNHFKRHQQTISVGVLTSAATGSAPASVYANAFNLHEGKRIDLAALVDPDGAHAVSWTSSNADIAEVFEDGQLLAWSIGRCTVTASWTDADGAAQAEEIEVRVTSALLVDSARDITITLRTGQTLDIARLFYPTYSASSLRDFGLSSSQGAVAAADGFVLSAKSAGSSVVNLYEREGFGQPIVQRFAVRVKD